MATRKNKVYYYVDDGGTLRKMDGEARRAAKGMGTLGTSAHTADRRLKGAAQASANGSKNFSKMAQGITGGLVPAYATLAANVFAISAAFNFLRNAADYKLLLASQEQFAKGTGTALGNLSMQLQSASRSMLSFRAASEAAIIGVAKGFSSSQMNSIAEGALKAATALGRGFDDTFNRLLRGISKAEPELLDELGITLRLETATAKYAATLGKSVKTLSAYERSQAVLNETMGSLKKTLEL